MGAWPPGVLEACGPCLSQRRNVLVTGITGVGKTTLLQALHACSRPTSPCLSWTTAKSWTGTVRSGSLPPCGAAILPNRLAKPWRERAGTRPGASFSPTCALPRPERFLRALGDGRHRGSLLGIGATSAETALRACGEGGLAGAALLGYERERRCEFELPDGGRKAGVCVNGEEGSETRKVLRALGARLEAPQPQEGAEQIDH